MFVFKKKNKPDKQIHQLRDLLKSDPENTKNRLKLADLHLRAGDKKSAIAEYQTAARYLSEEGFNLKAISIYKKILTLDSMSLTNYKSLASLYTEEGLLAEARRTYEKILHVRPEDLEAQEALKELETGGGIRLDEETGHIVTDSETGAMEDSDPVPIEALLAPSEGEEEAPDVSSDLPEEGPDELHFGEPSDDNENEEEGISLDQREDFEIDIGKTQADDALDIMESTQELETDDQGSLHGKVLRDLTIEDLSDTAPSIEEIQTPPTNSPSLASPQPSPLATPDSSSEDPHLHYHLGVAYREMELTDQAIEEFTKALEKGIEPLECLITLARCHFEKGLFQDAADFIHRALRLENLTQEQTDLLRKQLDEVEGVGKLS
jgi:tetratricopeptide (TPR) repeat protein